MFRGISLCNIDKKGRFAIPKKHRNSLADILSAEDDENQSVRCIVTIDAQDPCLLLYKYESWLEIERKIQALPSLNSAARRIQRILIGHAAELEMDNGGRFLLPSLLREHVKIDKRLMLVGQGNKFEIWAEEVWEQQCQKMLSQEDGGHPLEGLPDSYEHITL